MGDSEALTDIDVVVLAVWLLGGDTQPVETEDVAVKASEIAPGRVAWRRYPQHIRLDEVRRACSTGRGVLLTGSHRRGWQLTPQGVEHTQMHAPPLHGADLSRTPLKPEQRRWRSLEHSRMLTTDA